MKNKLLYLIGIFISGLGDGIQQIAIMWYIYHLTGEATSIGLMIAIYYLPSMIITPFVSVYVDHHDTKNIVVITDFIRFMVVLCMAIFIWLKIEFELLFYVLQFFLAVCYTIYKPASQAFIKESFLNKDLSFIISKSSAVNDAATIIGAGISGLLLVKASLFLSFFINSLTFLVASILYFLIKIMNAKQIKNAKVLYLSEILEGWNYINTKSGMKYLLFLSILNSISIQMTTTLLLPLAKKFHSSSELYSLFEIAFSIGGIVAGVIVTYFLRKLRHKMIVGTMLGMMVTSLFLFLNDYKFVAALLIFVLGLFTMAHLITVQTLIQLNTAKEYIGRVIGLRTILASFIKISSALLTGTLITKIGIDHILLSFTLVMMICLLTINQLRKVLIPENI